MIHIGIASFFHVVCKTKSFYQIWQNDINIFITFKCYQRFVVRYVMLNAEISHLGLQIRMVTKTTHPLFFLRVAFPSISPFCSPDFSIPLTPNITLCSISIQTPLTMINPSLVNTLKELVVKTKKNINTTAYLSQSLRLNDLEESTELEHLFASSHIEYKVNSTWIKMNHSVEDSLSEQINQVISFFFIQL